MELNLYCALEGRVAFQRDVRAVHLRGPETLHRRFPQLYRGARRADVESVQKKMPYLDVLLPITVYYAIGLWSRIDELDWACAREESRGELDRLVDSSPSWLTDGEIERIAYARQLMG